MLGLYITMAISMVAIAIGVGTAVVVQDICTAKNVVGVTVPVTEVTPVEDESAPINILDPTVNVVPLEGLAEPLDLEHMTIQRLRTVASENHVQLNSRDKKADIVRKLREVLPA